MWQVEETKQKSRVGVCHCCCVSQRLNQSDVFKIRRECVRGEALLSYCTGIVAASAACLPACLPACLLAADREKMKDG
jgi:hypothetical protein